MSTIPEGACQAVMMGLHGHVSGAAGQKIHLRMMDTQITETNKQNISLLKHRGSVPLVLQCVVDGGKKSWVSHLIKNALRGQPPIRVEYITHWDHEHLITDALVGMEMAAPCLNRDGM